MDVAIQDSIYEPIVSQYNGMQEQLRLFGAYLNTLIPHLLASESIDGHVYWRVKSLSSVLGKMSRKGTKYRDPLVDIPDLLGLRIVVLHSSDISRVALILANEFEVRADDTSNKSVEMGIDRIGYNGLHQVIRLRPPRSVTTECEQFSNCHCEVQTRSLLQHAWAENSRALFYDRREKIPSSLNRRLNLLAAILEAADNSFEELKAEILRFEEQCRDKPGQVSMEAAVLTNTMKTLSEAYVLFDDWIAAGYRDRGELGEANSFGEVGANLMYCIAKLCSEAEIYSLQDLDNYLVSTREWRLRYFTEIRRRVAVGAWFGTLESAIMMILVPATLHPLDIDQLVEVYSYSLEIAKEIASVAAQFHLKASAKRRA